MTRRSTTSALLTVTHDILHSLHSGNEVCSVFDLKKAFGSVPHSQLIVKLQDVELYPYIVRWVYGYLHNRTQFVIVGGEQSPTLPVLSGVPQGLVLGPLLFLIYINDIANITSLSMVTLFADDITLYRSIQSFQDYLALQVDVTLTTTWVSENYLASMWTNVAICCSH